MTRGRESVMVALSKARFGKQTGAASRAEQLVQGFEGTDADGVPDCTSLTALGRHAGFAVHRKGAASTAGQQLGAVGRTGNSTGPHLRFEMSKGPTWSYGDVAKPTW
ncbi:hypothetical protein [Streptomyces prasinus]|uniref:hypothetical protein n=1 Tax=Streptomyces prasinus TaxID=67345 RepID=UPI003F4B274C